MYIFPVSINILIMYSHAIPTPATRKHILFTAWKFYHLEAGNSSVGSLACRAVTKHGRNKRGDASCDA